MTTSTKLRISWPSRLSAVSILSGSETYLCPLDRASYHKQSNLLIQELAFEGGGGYSYWCGYLVEILGFFEPTSFGFAVNRRDQDEPLLPDCSQ